jgi:hypothetical protein
MKSTKSQLKMHYGACPKKLEARYQTIIKTYRDHYGKQSIPKNSQYWSICGRCSYEMNKLEDNCEPDQLIKAKLIKPNQFFGVEINPEIYEFNKSNKGMNWFLGDFYEQMVEYSNYNIFSPAIVNIDMLLMPKCGVEYFARIMSFLSSIKTKNIMVVANFIIKTRQHVAHKEDIVKRLEREPLFQNSMSINKWRIYNQFYWYNGTGKTRTKMGSIILFKN